MPRILSVGGDGYLRQIPAPEFATLRGQDRVISDSPLTDRPVSLGAGGDSLEIEAEFAADTASAVGLRVRSSADAKNDLAIAFHGGEGVLSIGSSRTHVSRGKSVRLRVYVDKCVTEVYANDGEAAMFVARKASGDTPAIEAFAEGGAARLKSARIWPLKPATFSLDRFHV